MTGHRISFFTILLFVSSVISVQAQQKAEVSESAQGYLPAQQTSTVAYRPSLGRLSLQFGSGILLGAGGGAVTGLAAGFAAPDTQYEPLSYMINGFYIGYSAASAIGVYFVANSSDYNASFSNILLGHGIGAGLGLGMIAAMDAIDGYMGPAYILALASPIIGGIVANKMSIKKRNSRTSALLNIGDSQLSISSPSVRLTKVDDFSNADKFYAPTVKLLNISL